MTHLKCTVNSCAHHKNECCCIPGICVGGDEAGLLQRLAAIILLKEKTRPQTEGMGGESGKRC